MKRVINGTVLIRCAALKFACCYEECSSSWGAIELRVAWIVIEKFLAKGRRSYKGTSAGAVPLTYNDLGMLRFKYP